MFRYALRRVLWSIPTLLATSLFLFLVVTTLAPPPRAPAGLATSDEASARIEEARRSQFFDLPRFFNANPRDVRSNAQGALAQLAADEPARGQGSPPAQGPPEPQGPQDEGARALARLGGAALPYVLPLFDSLSPDARGRAAVALAPVAGRMGLGDRAGLDQPETAA